MYIDDIISQFKKIVAKNSLTYFEGGSVTECPWHICPPADISKIENFERRGFVIPDDLKTILQSMDGIYCASQEQSIYGIDTILELSDVNKETLKSGIYEFAYFMGDALYIDSSRVNDGNYIFFEGSGFNQGVLLGYDIATLFDRLIASNFHNFWRWTYQPPEKISYLLDR